MEHTIGSNNFDSLIITRYSRSNTEYKTETLPNMNSGIYSPPYSIMYSYIPKYKKYNKLAG